MEVNMNKNLFNVEITSAGQQLVIPGTEKPTKIAKKRHSKEENQFVIPGAEKISLKLFASRLAAKLIRPRVPQRGLHSTALFGSKEIK